MRKLHRKMQRKTTGAGISFSVLFFAVLFLGGILLGMLSHRIVSDNVGDELGLLIGTFQQSEPGQITFFNLLQLFGLYFRFPLVAFLCCGTALGVVAIPLMSIWEIFSLSFSIACFSATAEKGGLLLVLALFGIRCLFFVPCTFVLAKLFFERSLRSCGGKRLPKDANTDVRPVIICMLLLLSGVLVEYTLTPQLLSYITSIG